MDANSSKSRNTDWTRCCLCQHGKKEDLKFHQAYPAKRGDEGHMYLARNISLFKGYKISKIHCSLLENIGIDTKITQINQLHTFIWKKTKKLQEANLLAILKNGHHLEFSNGQSRKFDQKSQGQTPNSMLVSSLARFLANIWFDFICYVSNRKEA